tara:strand:+ start:694 stop:951 length:258 start_codon:yes stop_codon:yes gene_type:complete
MSRNIRQQREDLDIGEPKKGIEHEFQVVGETKIKVSVIQEQIATEGLIQFVKVVKVKRDNKIGTREVTQTKREEVKKRRYTIINL